MIKAKRRARLNFTVAEGSALEQFLASNTNRTASAAIHEMAAAYAAIKERK
jgi:hypothetical protein